MPKRTRKQAKRGDQKTVHSAIMPRRNRNLRVEGFTGMERKFADQFLSSSALQNAWTLHNPSATVPINGIAIGDGESERDGRTAWIYSVMIRGSINYGATVDTAVQPSDSPCRVVLVLDNAPNGANPTPGSVMTSPTMPMLGFQNLQFSKRFKVLKDIYVHQEGSNPSTQQAPAVYSNPTVDNYFEMFHTFKKPLEVNFNGSTEQIGSIVKNSISVIACIISGVGAPTINYASRIRFKA